MFMFVLLTASQNFACGNFFGLHSWNQYIPGSNGACDNNIVIAPNKLIGTIPLIALAVLDDVIRVAGMVAVIFVIYGGFQYVISQGSPDATAAARNTIINAFIGLILAILSTFLVGYIAKQLGA